MYYLAKLETTHYVIIAVIAAIVIGIAAYYIVRAMKGKIEIELPKKGFNGGEEISGRVTLITKKALQLNRMYVALVGYEIIETTKTKSDGSTSRSNRKKEVYRNEVNILEAQQVPAGLNQAFDFTMNAPGGSATQVSETAAKVAGAVQTAATVLNALGGTNNHRRREWKVEARADLPGVDIAKSQKVRVNLI